MLHLSPLFKLQDPGFTLPEILVGLAVAVIVAILWVAWTVKQKDVGPVTITVTAILVAGVCGIAGTCITTIADGMTVQSERNQAVAQWLENDYGIDVSNDAAADLLGGNERIVKYQGASTVINLMPTGDNHIAVVSADDHTVLTPKDEDK